MFEQRFNSIEVRADAKAMRVSGYAATYGTRSGNLGGFRERIDKGAFDSVLAKNPDVVATFNHSLDAVIGRTSAGTLQLRSDSKGLAFDCDLPDTQLGRDLYTSVKRGDIKDCSFAFRGVEDTWDEEDFDDEDGERCRMPVRSIRSIAQLHDVALVARPAYPGTEVHARQAIVATETRSALDAFIRTKVSNESDLERGKRICEEWQRDSTTVLERRRSILNLL